MFNSKFQKVYRQIIAEQTGVNPLDSQICVHIGAYISSTKKQIIVYDGNGIQKTFSAGFRSSTPQMLAIIWQEQCVPYIMQLIKSKYLVGNTFYEIQENLSKFNHNLQSNDYLENLYKNDHLGNLLIDADNTQIVFLMHNTAIGSIYQNSTPQQIQIEIANLQKALLHNDNFGNTLIDQYL